METTYVLLKPLLTEKTTLLKDEAQQVAFYVHPKANKLEIKQAVEKAFDVKVEAVNVVRRAPSVRERQGRASKIHKRTSHITVILAEGQE